MFNGGMAKKKSGAQKKKSTKKSKGGALEQLKRVKWYMWVLIALTFYFGGLYTFKYFATQHDIKLLDEAEAKMRQLDYGEATSVEYSRSCSVRSVKYGDPGRPSCRTLVTAKYTNPENVSSFRSVLERSGYSTKASSDYEDTKFYDIVGFSAKLDCSLGEIYESEALGGDRISFYCQKKFWKKVYPEA